MKLVNDILGKVGTDKALHFAVGGLMCAVVLLVWQGFGLGWAGELLAWAMGLGAVLAASVVKELLDESFDWGDVGAGAAGCAVVLVALLAKMMIGAMA